mgnify:CR=1 FL=1
MATFTKINDFVKHVNEGVHNMASHQLELALSNTAPASETSNPTADGNGILGNVSEILYTDLNSPFNITLSSSAQTAGVYTLTLTDFTITCSGAGANAFRYVYVFNDNPTSPIDPLVCVFDYGSSLTLNNGESLLVDFGSDGGGTGALYTMT